MKRTALRLFIVASGVVCMAWGQEEGPGRGVARVSVMNGDVSVRRGDSGEVVAAALNAPLVVQDQLLTGPDSRAEVQLDWANMVRVAAMSEVRFAELENQRYQIQVARGLVTFRVLRDSNAQVEISTPSVSVRPVRQGAYRISVREDGTAEISVRSGEAEIFTPQGSERLPAGRTMLARGTASDPEFQIAQAVPGDDWDRWNEERDRQLEGSRSYNYVSRDIYGAEDLDRYGTWQNDPSYGDTWYPRVADDWAPYRDGRWSWVDYYGWSWVSNDPWGWAPYHYGRWYHNPSRGWGWWPGDRHGRHHWSPGLVAFVGWDGWGGTRAGIGFGGIGWIPLAPHERYYPWYGSRHYAGYRNGGHYANGMGLVNNFNFNSGYRNAGIRNAITGVDGHGFVSGRRGSAVQMNDGRLGRASLVRGALPVTPGRESLRLSDRAVGTSSLPRSRSDTRFVSRQQPARVDRVPFEDQRRGMDQMARRTFGDQRSAVNAGGLAGRSQGTSDVPRGAAPASRQGWQRAGDVAPGGNSTGAGNSGWRRFSEPRNGGQGAAGRPQSQSSGGSLRGPQSSQPNIQGGGVSRSSRDSWSRFGTGSGATGRDLGSGNSSPRSVGRGQNYPGSGGSVAPRPASPRYESPRTSSPQVYRGGGQAQVRVNPPIVRERVPSSGGGSYSRPAPSSGGGSYSRPAPSSGGGSYSRSAPSSGGGSYSRPAPSGGGNSRSTPSSGGGGRGSDGHGRDGRGGRSR
ncbi:MAG: FecR domain-containing protein [Bryobacterales bacterium]|nr:FecR domain-containing protein [Bryobacterales bacterium]